jgi:hypothetical protein
LAADFPAVPAYRRDLARSHNNLVALLREQGDRAGAAAAYRAALAIREKLVADYPDVPSHRQDLENKSLALSSVSARAGKVVEAGAMADHMAGGKAPSAGTLYNCACVFALTSAASNNPSP